MHAVNVKLILFSTLILGTLLSQSALYAVVPDEVQAVFANNTCLNCHVGNNPSGGLSLDDATISDMSLVDVVANCSNNNSKLVDPGNPEISVLYIKLLPNPNCGQMMPLGGQAISAVDLTTIYDWIVSIGPAAQFGLFLMDAVAVTAQETDPSVTLTVNRELGAMGAVTVDFAVSTLGADNAEDENSGSAEDPSDYIAQTGTLTFADGEMSKEIVVVLTDDDVFESTEVFSVSLSNAQGGAVLDGAVQTKVSITDNEFDNQPGAFFFERVSYNANENDGTLDVRIIRSFGAAGQITLDVASTDGSALSGGDYQTISSTLVFAEGERNQTFSITLVDDAIEEQAESFTLSLSPPSDGELLGGVQNTTVNIADDDAANAGGGGNGGDTGGTGGTTAPPPEEEAEFEAAGSILYLLSLLCLFGFVRRR